MSRTLACRACVAARPCENVPRPTPATANDGRLCPMPELLIRLIRPLTRFCHAGRSPGRFRFGFLLRRIALRFGLVLLGLTFTEKVIATGQRTDHRFDLALDAFDDAL